MDARIRFETKEEANARREREFLALSPSERFQWFLSTFKDHPRAEPEAALRKGNFIVAKRKDALR